MTIKNHIPNFLTCCNLLCGFLGIHTAFYSFNYSDLTIASFFIFAACLFDFFDGFAARLLKVSSPIGKELDSLADGVTFGVLPGVIIYKLIEFWFQPLPALFVLPTEILDPVSDWSLPLPDTSGNPNVNTTLWIKYHFFFDLAAALISIFSAIRLAKFNIDTRQSDSFIGVPTPANGILVASFPLILAGEKFEIIKNIMGHPGFLVVYSILMSYLLIAELPLFALKFKNFSWQDNKMKYILLISVLILFIIFQWVAIPMIIFLYILLSFIENKLLKSKI